MVDSVRLSRARRLLAQPQPPGRLAPVIGAAALFAASAMALVALVISLPSPWPT